MAEDGVSHGPNPDPSQQPNPWPSPHETPPQGGRPTPPPGPAPGDPAPAGWASPSYEYGTPGHPAPQYPAPPGGPQPPAPWGYGQQPQQPPHKKSRTGLIVGLAVGVVVLLVAGVAAVGLLVSSSDGVSVEGSGSGASESADAAPSSAPSPSESSTPTPPATTLGIPGGAAGFTQLKGATARRLVANLRRQMNQATPGLKVYDKAKIAIYAKGSEQLFFIGLPGTASPLIGDGLERSPESTVDSFLLGANVKSSSDYPAGSPGEILRCGRLSPSGGSVAMCVWADHSNMIVTMDATASPKTLSTVARKFRDASVQGG